MPILKIIAATLLSILFIRDGLAQTGKEGYALVCNLTGFEEGTKFFLVNLDNEQKVTTLFLKNQKLLFKGKLTEPAVHRLYYRDEKGSINDLNFWLENKAMTLTATKNSFADAVIKGSPINDIDCAVHNKYKILQNQRDNLMRKWLQETDDSEKSQILKTVSEIDKKVLATRLKTIAAFDPSLITVKELFFLRNDLSREELQKLFKRFPVSLKKTKYGQVIEQYIKTNDIKVGAKSVDIAGSNSEKSFIKLSDFKDKVVLLDFWASWCLPCRKSNKEIAELYRKYQSRGFEIISFSTDTDPASWQNASKDDGIFWTNISDLKGFYSEQIASYKIRAIPRGFLIDKNGDIVHIFNGYNQESKKLLEAKIEKLTE